MITVVVEHFHSRVICYGTDCICCLNLFGHGTLYTYVGVTLKMYLLLLGKVKKIPLEWFAMEEVL